MKDFQQPAKHQGATRVITHSFVTFIILLLWIYPVNKILVFKMYLEDTSGFYRNRGHKYV